LASSFCGYRKRAVESSVASKASKTGKVKIKDLPEEVRVAMIVCWPARMLSSALN
jgi:hypothetical protein